MVWCRSGNKPSSEPLMLRLSTHICLNDLIKMQWLYYRKMSLSWFILPERKYSLQKYSHIHSYSRKVIAYFNPDCFLRNYNIYPYTNTLGTTQNGRHFADDIFKRIFLNGNVWMPIKISLQFVPQGPINNILALFQIMALRRPGDQSLSGPMMVRLPTHICVTLPQWVNDE